jgi:hypothetical protein
MSIKTKLNLEKLNKQVRLCLTHSVGQLTKKHNYKKPYTQSDEIKSKMLRKTLTYTSSVSGQRNDNKQRSWCPPDIAKTILRSSKILRFKEN